MTDNQESAQIKAVKAFLRTGPDFDTLCSLLEFNEALNLVEAEAEIVDHLEMEYPQAYRNYMEDRKDVSYCPFADQLFEQIQTINKTYTL